MNFIRSHNPLFFIYISVRNNLAKLCWESASLLSPSTCFLPLSCAGYRSLHLWSGTLNLPLDTFSPAEPNVPDHSLFPAWQYKVLCGCYRPKQWGHVRCRSKNSFLSAFACLLSRRLSQEIESIKKAFLDGPWPTTIRPREYWKWNGNNVSKIAFSIEAKPTDLKCLIR